MNTTNLPYIHYQQIYPTQIEYHICGYVVTTKIMLKIKLSSHSKYIWILPATEVRKTDTLYTDRFSYRMMCLHVFEW